jgi:hypothetical protein
MIFNRQRRVPVAIRPLQQFHERVRQELGFAPGSVTIELISDLSMTQLNETFRKKSGPTSCPFRRTVPARQRTLRTSAISPSPPQWRAETPAGIRDHFPWKCGF